VNRPTGRTWEIERSATAPRGRGVAGPNASLTTLADQIGLEATEFREWLGVPQQADGITLADGRTIAVAALQTTDLIREGEAVEVPNTVFLLWVGDLGWFGRFFVRRSSDERYLRACGFLVVAHDGVETSAADWLDEIGQASARKELHGLFVTGHGLAAGFGATAWQQWSVEYRELVGDGMTTGRLRYRLGLVIINACLGNHSRTDTTFHAPRPIVFGFGPLWRAAPLPVGTTILAGARDLVAQTPNACFFGVKGILNPVVTTCHVWDLLRPGDQGTRRMAR
jgi:hypothetical protein